MWHHVCTKIKHGFPLCISAWRKESKCICIVIHWYFLHFKSMEIVTGHSVVVFDVLRYEILHITFFHLRYSHQCSWYRKCFWTISCFISKIGIAKLKLLAKPTHLCLPSLIYLALYIDSINSRKIIYYSSHLNLSNLLNGYIVVLCIQLVGKSTGTDGYLSVRF